MTGNLSSRTQTNGGNVQAEYGGFRFTSKLSLRYAVWLFRFPLNVPQVSRRSFEFVSLIFVQFFFIV